MASGWQKTRTVEDIDARLIALSQMLTRAVNVPDLPNVLHFSKRIDEVLEERLALTSKVDIR